jgi:hypothetical protein
MAPFAFLATRRSRSALVFAAMVSFLSAIPSCANDRMEAGDGGTSPGGGGRGSGGSGGTSIGSGGINSSGGTLGIAGENGSGGAGNHGGVQTGGNSGTANSTGAGGSAGPGGATGAGGVTSTGGRGTGGESGTGGIAGGHGGGAGGQGGSTGTGAAAGGAVGAGGASISGMGGYTGSGGMTGTGGGSGSSSPFGCKFAWGEPSPGGSLSSYGWLQFMTNWAGQSVKADGSVSSCESCAWLSQLASTNLIPAYYAYIIGFYGHANGLPDGNQSGGPNLTTGGSALILGAANVGCPAGQLCAQNKIVQAYAYYAKQSHAAWPTKPLVWLLEGDFVQYAASSQSQPLSYAQLGQLAALITTAIKTNMPNAIVAMDHSTWNSDAVTTSFWTAMKQADLDMVWTTGVGNNNGFLSTGTNASSYNGKTCTYSYLHSLTGKKILVDESAGLSQAGDTWSNQSAATINARIAEGVAGINVSGAPSNYQSNVANLSSQLNSTCP